MSIKKKNYLENDDLQREILASHSRGQLTNEAVRMFRLMINKISGPLPYKDQELKKDVQAWAMYVCCKKWQKYDTSQNTAFSYFTSTIINGLREGFKRYSRNSGSVHIPIDALLNSQNSQD